MLAYSSLGLLSLMRGVLMEKQNPKGLYVHRTLRAHSWKLNLHSLEYAVLLFSLPDSSNSDFLGVRLSALETQLKENPWSQMG